MINRFDQFLLGWKAKWVLKSPVMRIGKQNRKTPAKCPARCSGVQTCFVPKFNHGHWTWGKIIYLRWVQTSWRDYIENIHIYWTLDSTLHVCAWHVCVCVCRHFMNLEWFPNLDMAKRTSLEQNLTKWKSSYSFCFSDKCSKTKAKVFGKYFVFLPFNFLLYRPPIIFNGHSMYTYCEKWKKIKQDELKEKQLCKVLRNVNCFSVHKIGLTKYTRQMDGRRAKREEKKTRDRAGEKLQI